MIRAAPFALALAALVAGCSDTSGAPAEQGGEASGEVLAGSVSDAMVPLDQLTSEAPLAPRQIGSETSLDAEQPVVDPVEGVEGAVPGEAAEAGVPAAPSPQAAPAG